VLPGCRSLRPADAGVKAGGSLLFLPVMVCAKPHTMTGAISADKALSRRHP
jgi:hypothetical protein